MVKNTKSNLRYTICFVSPFFVVYVKCPQASTWQLARSQTAPVPKTAGTTSVLAYPVLLFTSRDAAVAYAETNLNVQEAKPRNSYGWLAIFFPLEKFEELRIPAEIIEVTKQVEVAPLVYAAPEEAADLPVAFRQRPYIEVANG